jgi:putative redox protein
MRKSPSAVVVRHLEHDRLQIRVGGFELSADQPVQDGGDGTAPSPTELFLAGVAACVAFFAERFLRRHDLTPGGLTVSCDFNWAENPHRIGEIELVVGAPNARPS